MISINKYGQNIDFSQIVAVNGKKSLSLDGLVLDKSLIIEVTKGTKFSTTLQEEDLKIEFKDVDGNIFELILKNMATLLAQNDGTQLVEIIQADDNKVLASITDITSALEAAAAGGAPAAGANGNSDSASNAGLNNDENNLSNSTYDNASLTNDLNTATTAAALSRANVAPIVAAIADQNVDEDNTLLINFSALDLNNDTLVSTATALNGTVTVNGNIITYVPNTNFNGNDTITLTVNDGLATTTQTIAITVNPINDAPVLNTITAVTVNEDAALFSGTITSSDVDANATAVYTTTSTVAGFTLNSNGTYTFDAADVAYQSLAAGVSQIITIPVTVTDDANATDTQNLTITITGTNDAPVLNTITAVTVNEDDSVFSGTITSSDVDANATAVYTTTSTVAGFTLNSNGTYTFDAADVAYQSLAAGVSQIITIPVTVTDDANATDTQNLTITITGTNDAPVLNTITAVTVNEDDSVFSGTITSSDVDANATAVYTTTSTVAGFTLNSNGTYTFDAADVAYQSLAAGVSQIITIPVTVTDDANATDTQNLTITITGTNDAPVLNTITAVTVNEDDSVFSGTITSSDVDANATAVYTTTSTVAGFTLNSNGTYTFDAADVAYQSLAAGVSQIITIPVTVTDDANATDTQNLTITITGTNDAPVLNTITAVTVNEDDSVFSGTITSSDVDANATAVYTTTSTVAGFTLNSNGTYTFDAADVAYQSLAAGVSQIITIPVTVTDDANATDTQNLTITITGTNDRPTIENININAITLVGKDLSDTHALSNTGDNVAYSYFTVTETTVVRITTDGPTIDPVLYLFRNDGNLDVTDYVAYNDDGWTQAGSANNSLINITLTAGNYIAVVGDYSFSMNEAISGINNGSYRDGNVSINFLADKDIILYNSNTTTSLYIEDSGLSNNIITGVINTVSDLDTADIHTYELVPGTALVNGVQLPNLTVSIYLNTISGNWEYKIDGDFNYLSEGEIANVTFDYIANDGKGFDGTDGINESSISESKVITLTVTGTNDKPVISAYTETTNVQENVLTGSISLTDVALVDVDLTDTHTFVALTNAVTTVVDTNSVGIGAITVSMDVNGNYTLSGAGIEKLGAGESATVTFSVQVKDDSATATNTSTPATITLTIDGSNDTPTVSNVVVNGLIEETSFVDYAGKSDLVYTSTVALSASDVDANDTYTFAKSSFTGTNGEAGLQVSLVQSDAVFMQVYTAASLGNTTALTALKAAFAELISKDAISAIIASSTTLSTLTDDIENASDFTALLAVLNNNSFLSLSATSTSVTVTAEATVAQTAILEASNAIKITVNANGTYTVASPFINSLAEGEVAKITFGYKAIDDSLAANNTSTPATVTLTVTGTNDKPVISAYTETTNVQENVLTGSISLTDVALVDVDLTDTHTFVALTNAVTTVVDTNSVGIGAITVSMDVNGNYTLSGAGIEKLGAGESATVTFSVQVKDDSATATNTSTPATITLTIDGSNDTPTVSNVVVNGLIEETSFVDYAGKSDLVYTSTVALSASDVDANDTYTFAKSSFTGTNGEAGLQVSLVQSDAVFMQVYTAASLGNTTALTALKAAFAELISKDAISAIIASSTTLSTLTDDIENASDFTALLAVLNNNSFLSLSATSTSVTVTAEATVAQTAILEASNAIKITVNANGTYTVASPFINSLAEGEVAKITFGYKAIDDSLAANNTSTPATVTLTVTGTNDKPVISAYTETTNVQENVLTGSISLTDVALVDVDLTDTHTFVALTNAVTTVVDTNSVGIGAITVSMDVNGNYTLSGAGIEKLGAGESATVTFSVQVKDDSATATNTSTPATITLTIDGSNDTPTVSNVVVNGLIEETSFVDYAGKSDLVYTSTVALSASDVDANDTYTFAKSSFTGTNGEAGLQVSLVQSDAVFMQVYTAASLGNTTALTALKAAFAELISKDAISAIIASSTTLSTLTDDIENASDFTALLAVLNNNSFLSLSATSTSVTVTAEATVAQTAILEASNAIKITVNANGTYTVASPFINSLAEGEVAKITFGYKAIDDSLAANNTSTPATVTLTVTGTNDKPVISAYTETTNVQENVLTGSISLTDVALVDVDLTDTHTFVALTNAVTTVVDTNSVGIGAITVSMDVNGNYTLSGAGIEKLGAGESATVTFSVQVKDDSATATNTSTPATITLTIDGSNDTPTVSNVVVNGLIEETSFVDYAGKSDLVYTSTVALSASDVDANDTYTFAKSSFTGTNGEAGLQVSLVQSDAVFMQVYTAASLGNTTALTALKAAFAELISKDAISAIIASSTTLSTLTDDIENASDFTALLAVLNNNSFLSLSATSTSVTVTAEATVAQTAILEASNAIKITVNANGTYTVASPFINSLAEGEVAKITFGYKAIDDSLAANNTSTPATVTLTVTGTNDKPVISAYTETTNVQENVLTGSISLTDVALVDVDLTDTHTFVALTNAVTTVVDTNSVGIGAITVSMDVNGNYTLSGAGIEKLGAGESATVTFSVQVKDDSATATNTSTPATITLTIDGSNDTPTVSNVVVNGLIEETSFVDYAGKSDLVYTSTVALSASDVDANDTYTFAKSSFTGTNGEAGLQVSLVQSDAVFMQVYTAASLGNTTALTALKAAFAELISKDAISAIIASSTTLSTLTDDIENASDFTALLAVLNNNSFLSLSATSTSVTVTAEATVAQTAILEASNAIKITVNANGTYTVASPFINSLAEGEVAKITFGYKAIDDSLAANNTSTPATVTLTVTGTNDKPVISAYTETTNVQENVLTGSISLTDVALVDVDLTDTHTFVALTNAVTTVVDTNSVGIGAITVSMDVNGNYTLSGAGIEKLGAGESATVTFSVQVKDDSATATNTSTPATITLTIDGSNDTPTVSNVVVNGLIEETSFVDYAGKSDLVYTSTVALSASDVDANDTYTFAKSSFTGTNGEAGLQVSLVQSDAVFMQVYTAASLGNTTALTALKAAFAELISKDAISAIIASSTTLSTLTDDIENASDFTALLAVLNNNSFLSLSATSTSVTVTAEATVAQTAILEASNAIKITVNANGTYTVASPFINSLAEGEVAKITFGYKAIDDSLAANNTSTPATVTLTVTGTNDKPVISAYTETTNVQENVLTGSISLTDVALVDVDLTDTHTFVALTNAVTTVVDTNSVGIGAITVSMDVNGNYTLSGAGIEKLGAGESATVTFSVQVKDDSATATNTSTPATITLTIDGSNDTPTVSNVVVNGLIEETSFVDYAGKSDLVYTSTVALSASDVDANDTYTFAKSSFTGTNGEAGLQVSLVQSDAVFMQVYTAASLGNTTALTALKAAFAELISKDAISAIIASSTTLSTLTDDIENASDFTALLAVLNNNSFLSLSATSTSVTVTAEATVAQTAILEASNAIKITVNANGTYTVASPFINSLAEGEVAKITFGYKAIDDSLAANNTSTPATVTLTVTGTNDKPVITTVSAFDVVTEPNLVDLFNNENYVHVVDYASVFNALTITDNDSTDRHTVELANATIYPDGGLYSQDAQFVFNTVDANGVNNPFTNQNAGVLQITQSLLNTYPQIIGSGNDFLLYGDGINAMGEGETATLTFTVVANDGTTGANGGESNLSAPQVITINITGTNDTPVITSLTASNVTESDLRGSLVAVVADEDVNDGYTFVVETVAATVDAGSAQNNAINIVSNVTVAIQSNGDYTVSGTGIENLAAGEITTITFDVRVSDGTTGANGGESDISATKSVSLTITGTNDAPIIAPVSNLVIESSLLDTPDAPSADSKYEGQLSATDADLTDTHTFYRSGTTLGLTITTSSSGLVNAFDTDQIEYVRNVVLKIVSIDEIKTLIDSTTDVDALAVINAVKNAPSIYDLKLILESVGITTTLDATAGTLTFNVLNAHILEELNLIEIDIMPTDGSYSITSSLFNHLGVSDNISLSFGYVAKDSSNEFSDPNTVTLKVTGTNDTPVVTKPVEINVIENTTTIDVDINSDKALSNYIYDFDITDDHNFNRFGETLGLTITTSSSGLVNAFDTDQIEYVRDVVLKIVSIDEIKTLIDSTTDVDALAVINAVKNAPSIDDLKLILSGVGITTTLDTTAGTLTFNVLNAYILEELNLIEINMLTDGDGSYSITSSLFNHLGVADTLSMSFGYSVTDSGAETVNDGIVTVNIQGTNDIPTINDVTISTNENTLTNSTKLEIGIDNQFALSNYSFDPDVTDDFTYLRSETNTKLGLTITSQDAVLLAAVENNNNLAYVKTLVSELISIPEIAAVLSSITNTTILTLIGQLQMATSVTQLVNMINAIPTVSLIKDASGLNLVLEDASILETTNLLKIVIDGSGSYTVESALFDRMSATTSVSLNFDYEAQDSGYSGGITQEATITVNIAGSNDRPEVIKVIVSNIETNGTQNFTGQLTATDADVGSVFTFEMVSTGGNNKNITNDGRQFESIEINGVFAKIISTKSNLTDPDEIAEDRTMLKSIVINGLSISSTGVYSVAGNFDALGEQESVTLRFAYKANDNSGETNALSQSNLVEITIQGTNDAPVAMGSSIIVSNDSVSYVGQLLANDLDVNDKLTYSYDNTASASMTLSVTDWINLGAIVPLNGVDNLSALSALNTLLTNTLTKTDFLTFMSTYGLSISTLKTFLVDNSDNILALKDLISSNQTIITQITSLNATDIALIDTLTAANIATLQDLFTALSSNVPNPNANANAYNHFFTAINDFITSHPNVLDLLDDAPMIISKIQSISTVDTLTGEITVTANMPSSMIDIDADTGEYEVLNLSLSSLPDNTQVEVNFGYTVTDSIDTSSATASMLISADDVTSKVSIDTNGVMTIEDNYSIDMVSLLSNASVNAAEVDSIDLSNSEHVLSNITISDFEQMVSDDGSNVLSITGDKDDVVKLDLSVWSKDNADTDLNSVVDSVDDNFIAYKATGTNDVLTLLIDKDIIVNEI